jgi:type IV pilus assembly protein PilY1
MKTKFAIKRLTATFTGAALALAGTTFSAAEDVDIFTAGAGTTSKPNVLIILDNSSNWSASFGANTCNTGNMAASTKFASEMCALKNVVGGLDQSVRVGLMMFAETGTNGGYVRYAIRDMTATNKQAFQDLVSNFVNNGSGTDNSGSNQPYGKVMFEAFKYFGGGTGTPQDATHYGPIAFAGGNSNNSGTYRRDYNGNNTGSGTQATANRAAPKYGADGNNAFSSSSTDTYNNPINDNCAKNFIIFISNGNPGTGGDSGSPTADTLLNNIGGNSAQRVMSAGTEVHASSMDEYARYLNSIDVSGNTGTQKIITYTIAVYQPQNNGSISTTDQSMIKLMKSAANVGGGKYFAATQASDVTNALLTILNEVQAVNSVFVSASLPVSVNTQGTFLNQVYMGLFRPDGSGSPRWLGNVKQYKFILDSTTGDLSLADSTGAAAVNPATGFISPNAISFWTSTSTFWTNNQTGIPPSASDSPDGDVVEKGGASEVQRKAFLTSQAARKIYTCTGACPTTGFGASDELNNTNITFAGQGAAFGASDATDLSMLIKWIRGEDNASGVVLSPLNSGISPCDTSVATCLWSSAESGPGWPNTVRPSIHGDVLHSRPVVLNYKAKGANTSTGPHMFYAANDGVLRAVKGGQAATDGTELWGFVASEFYGKYRRLRYALPELRTPGTPPGLIASTLPKDYFFDGPIGTFEDNSTTPETKWIFVGSRRGGPVIYAFDVSIPTNPKFMWKTNTATLTNLGQTWSLPVAFRLPHDGAGDPFLVLGAGYDVGEDASPVVNNGKGRGIYVLNARTGGLLRFINTTFDTSVTVDSPIASDVGFLAKLDPATGGFGDVYRGYVGDLNGNVWRLDIPDATVGNWKLFKFAALGTGLKFMYAPDLVKAGDKDVVLIGSGDREKPLAGASQDYFFGLYDKVNATTAAAAITPILFADTDPLTATAGTTCSTCKGFRRAMAPGEKVVNSPLTVAGITFFATNVPTPPAVGSCASNLGEAKTYGISFLTGGLPAGRTTISTVLTGGGLAPSPVGGVVDLGKPDGSEGGQTVAFCIGCGKKDRLEPERPNIIVPTTRRKIYWNMKNDG